MFYIMFMTLLGQLTGRKRHVQDTPGQMDLYQFKSNPGLRFQSCLSLRALYLLN